MNIETMERGMMLLKRVRAAWIHHYMAPEILVTLYEYEYGDLPCEHPSYFIPYRDGKSEFCSVCGEFKA